MQRTDKKQQNGNGKGLKSSEQRDCPKLCTAKEPNELYLIVYKESK